MKEDMKVMLSNEKEVEKWKVHCQMTMAEELNLHDAMTRIEYKERE